MEGNTMSESTYQDQAAQEARADREGHEHGDAKGTLTLSATDFTALEERVMRAVDVVRRERLARLAAEERASRAEAQMREHQSVVEQVEKELGVLRAERDHVRERVDRLLGQLDALEL
jgi:FtsZ-binding cell division protein ZapB